MDTQQLINSLRQELPPVFSRKVASRMTGGLFAPGTLANLDSMGQGPGGVRVGKAIAYERERFLAWFEKRLVKKSTGSRGL